MHILNLFFIPLVLISLYFGLRISYLVALLISLACATFIFSGQNLANLLLSITIFNLVPLACWALRFNLKRHLFALEEKRNNSKSDYEQIFKEHALIRQSNLRLEDELSRIVELYKLTRDMSSVLGFEQVFEIFSRKLMENSPFKSSRLLLIDEEAEGPALKKVYQLKDDENKAQVVDAQAADTDTAKQSLEIKRPTYLEGNRQTLAPLRANSKTLGAVAVEGLAPGALENFSILTNQFSLEFKRVKLYQRVQELAITDGLTGLFVRRHFLERAKEEIERSSRHNLKLSFLMLDIDHFKQCNDQFGHLSGDVVLKEVAAAIRACVREIDLVARYGGEEFAVLLPDTGKFGARGVAERIRATIAAQKIIAYEESLKVQISIGLASFPEDTTGLHGLIDKADQALYRAKQQGRNQVVCF